MTPSIRSVATTNGTSASATPTINLPATVSAGDTIFVAFRSAGGGAVGWPSPDWNELADSSADASVGQVACAWKKADGTEGGTTITLSAANSRYAAVAWAVQDAADPTLRAPEISSAATGSGTEPNAGSLSPTGGSKDYLYLTFFGMEGEQTGITAYPADYTLGQSGLANSGTAGAVTSNATVAGAARQKGLTTAGAASDDAGAWNVTGTLDDWTAYTVAFHPAPQPVGTLLFAGQAPALAAPDTVAIEVQVGAIASSGRAPRLAFIGPTVGHLALAGLAASLLVGPILQLPSGGLAPTGQNPTLSIQPTGGQSSISVPVGTLTAAGTTPSLVTVAATIGIPNGTLVSTGYAYGLAFLGPTVGGATLAGLAPTVSIESQGSNPVPVPVGAVTATGAAPSVARAIGTPSGSLATVGSAPLVVAGSAGTVAVPAGSTAFVGQYVGVRFSTPPPGQASFTGRVPSLAISNAVFRSMPTGTDTLAGAPPTVARAALGVSGSLDATGHVPALARQIGPLTGQVVIEVFVPAPGYDSRTDVGAISFQSAAPLALVGLTVAPPAGALTVTGEYISPMIYSDDDIGRIELTGYAPSLVISNATFIEPTIGAVSLVGAEPALAYGVDVPAGSLAHAGLAATVQAISALAMPPGFVALSGTATVPAHAVSATIGQVVFQSAAPTPFVARDVPAGALTATGLAPTLGLRIVATVGQVVLEGLQPNVGGDNIRSMPVGVVSLTGLAANHGRALALPPGSVALTGHAVALSQSVGVPDGILALQGIDPAVAHDGITPMDDGTVALVGLPPIVTVSYGINVPVTAIACVGRAPALMRTLTVVKFNPDTELISAGMFTDEQIRPG